MKYLVALVLGFSWAAYASDPIGCTDKYVAAAEKLVTISKKETSKLYQWAAEDTLLNTKLCAGKIAKADYCAEKEKSLDANLQAALAGAQLGSPSIDVSFIMDRLISTRTICHRF
jgi:hypothetical protein